MHDGSAIRSNKLDANSFSIAKIGKIWRRTRSDCWNSATSRPTGCRSSACVSKNWRPSANANEEDAARRPQRWTHFYQSTVG